MTSIDEAYVMERFSVLYSKMPTGIVEAKKPPFPDYLFSTDSKELIGIELTEIIHSEIDKEFNSSNIEITNRVLEQLRNRLHFNFNINITQNRTNGVKKSHRERIIKELTDICIGEFYYLENLEVGKLVDFGGKLQTFPIEVQSQILVKGYRNLPEGINSIRIGRYDIAGESWNSQLQGGSIPDITQTHISKILETKNTKIDKYSFCNQYWLVIWEGNNFTGFFGDTDIKFEIKSRFDNVFLIRTAKNEIIVLK